MPHLEFDTFIGQIFWLAILFVAFYFIVSKLLLPNVADVLENRAEHIAHDIDKAENLKNEAVDAQIHYERVHEKSTSEARKTLEEAMKKTEAAIDAKRKDLQIKIDKSLLVAEKKISDIQQESSSVVSKISVELAKKMAQKVTA
jgi:F-type H+-transporting ATPase subunit b